MRGRQSRSFPRIFAISCPGDLSLMTSPMLPSSVRRAASISVSQQHACTVSFKHTNIDVLEEPYVIIRVSVGYDCDEIETAIVERSLYHSFDLHRAHTSEDDLSFSYNLSTTFSPLTRPSTRRGTQIPQQRSLPTIHFISYLLTLLNDPKTPPLNPSHPPFTLPKYT